MTGGWFPRARSEQLLTEEIGEELVVYDSETSVAHCLSAQTARVWRSCDGTRDLTALASTTGLDHELVAEIVAELQATRLLADEERSPAGGLSRRSALKRLGMVAVAAGGSPFIYSAVIPNAAAALSGGTCSSCTSNANCTSPDVCDTNLGVCAPSVSCIFVSSCTTGKNCGKGIFHGTCTGITCGASGTLCC